MILKNFKKPVQYMQFSKGFLDTTNEPIIISTWSKIHSIYLEKCPPLLRGSKQNYKKKHRQNGKNKLQENIIIDKIKEKTFQNEASKILKHFSRNLGI